jgi:hypothetical protein
MHILYALICLLAGGGLTWAGYRISRPYERPHQATGFLGPILSRHLLIASAGYLLVIFGLIIGMMFTLIFLLAG